LQPSNKRRAISVRTGVKIEKMARDCLASGTFENGRIKLVML
jgi:hypothetical protein